MLITNILYIYYQKITRENARLLDTPYSAKGSARETEIGMQEIENSRLNFLIIDYLVIHFL